MNTTRLTATSLKAYRLQKLAEQRGLCELCKEPAVSPSLDHCHKTGKCRGVLCRGCNAMLGHIENNMARHLLSNMEKLMRFCRNLEYYIEGYRDHDYRSPLHPTHKTEEEKRLLKNKRAKVARAKVKQTKLDLVKELSK